MPVIGRAHAARRGHLTDLLFKELMGESTRKGPVIFEDPVGPDEIDVTVVWEAWQALSPDDRISIIRKAYSRYSRILEESVHYLDPNKPADSPMVPRVGMVIGATWQEVEKLDLLPYSIVPDPGGEAVDRDEIERVMIEAGAIETPQGFRLRFPKPQMAMEIHARLMEEMPEAQWVVVEDTRAIYD